MTIERAIFAFAGAMILLSLVLTHIVHPNFIWLTVFIGANLLQFSITGFCPIAILLKKMGIQSEAENALTTRV